MTSEASTLPLPDGALPRRGRSAVSSGERTGARGRQAAVAVSLVAIVGLCLLVVVMAANRPSVLSPTTHSNYYPRWMAGPLGGLWPGLTDNSTTLKYWFSGAIVAMYVAYAVVLKGSARVRPEWILATVLAVHIVFVLSPPLALTDIFNYINYGRMEAVHHLNPYTTIPILEPHDDPSYALSNWHQLLSPYGPLFTMLTFLVVPLGVGASFWILKLVLAAASLATLALVYACARLLGRDPVWAVAFVGLNPIVLVWGLGGDHNDFLMMLCIVGAFYLLLRARASERGRPQRPSVREWFTPPSPALLGAGAAFVVAAGLKASAAVLIPVVLAGLLSYRRALAQVLVGMVVAGVLVGALSLLAFGLHIPDLSTQSRLVTSESVPNLIGLAVGAGGETAALHKLLSVALIVSVLACCWYAWRPPRGNRRDAPGAPGIAERTIVACGWASVALLVSLSWVLPWYVLWVLPLAALSASRRLRGAALALGVYLIIAWAPASGQLWDAIGFHPEKTSLGRLHQRAVRELLNRLVEMAGPVPDFFIVGHRKCGTTALYQMLRGHPEVYMPAFKEPRFLETRPGETPLRRPENTGRTPADLEEYLALFAAAAPGQRVGEASPSYLLSPASAECIAQLQPQARIIAILREPASYLRSFHLQQLRIHSENEKDLRKAIELEPARREGHNLPPTGYWPEILQYSQHVRYVEQLERYRAHFAPEQMLVLIYDDLRSDNEGTIRRILRFLEIDEAHPIRAREANHARAVRSQRTYDLIHAVATGDGTVARGARSLASKVAPKRLNRDRALVIRNRILYSKPQPPDERLMTELRERFKPEVIAAGEYLGRDLVTLWGYDRLG